MNDAVRKNCCFCGLDVRRLPRTKDRRGNYYCKPCYRAKLAEYRHRLRDLAAQSAAGVAIRTRREEPSAGTTPTTATATHARQGGQSGATEDSYGRLVPEIFLLSQDTSDAEHRSDSSLLGAALPVESAEQPVAGPSKPTSRRAALVWILPVIACALLAFSLDRNVQVQLGALIGLAMCATAFLILALLRLPGSTPSAARPGEMVGFSLRLVLMLGITALGVWLGLWRAGTWGAAWMGGGAVLATAIVMRRPRSAVTSTAAPLVIPAEPSESIVRQVRTELASQVSSTDSLQQHQKADLTAVQVRRRVRRRRSKHDVRISDLLSEEALEEVEAAMHAPQRMREPEIPVSPITNPPVTSLVANFSALLLPHAATSVGQFDGRGLKEAYESSYRN